MKRTNPKGSDDPGFVRCSWEEALGMIAANLKAIREKIWPRIRSFSSAVILRSLVPLSCAWPVISVLGTMLLNPPLLAVKGSMLAEELTFGVEYSGGCGLKTKSYLVIATNGAW